MEVKYRLAAVGIGIDHHTITVVGKSAIACYVRSRLQQTPERVAVARLRLVQRVDMLSRDDQNMGRSLRADVVKGNAHIVLKYPGGRYLAACDLTKKAIFYTHDLVNRLNHKPPKLLIPTLCLGLCVRGRAFGDSLDIGAEAAQFADDRLVSAIDMINAVNDGLAAGAQRGQHQRSRGP